MNIRKATARDKDLLVEFNRAMAEETEAKTLSLDKLTAGVRAVFEDADRGFYLIAEVDGTPAGGLLITTEWSDWRNAYFWWIQSVYVFPAYRKKGVYKMLHNHVVETARQSGGVCGIRLYVDRDNAGAKATYERLGMTPGRYDFYELTLDENG